MANYKSSKSAAVAADYADRLHFLGIDQAAKDMLRAAAPIISAALPEILNAFYTHLGGYPKLAAMFGPGGIDRAKQLQGNHWLSLFSGRFDDEYFQSVQRVGQVHSQIGLEPQWYIGAYSFSTSKILAAITTASIGRWHAERDAQTVTRLHAAVLKAVMLDMDLAISIYLEENNQRHDEHLREMSDTFTGSVQNVVDGLAAAAVELNSSATAMSDIAHTSEQRSAVVATASEHATANVQTVAAAAEELSSSIQEISRQVSESAEVAGVANTQASQANQTLQGLSTAAQRIGEVVQLITDIAAQTNLLALNATIEAARAGDAGKGFAVVANEVKNLANQTGRATDDIRSHIEEMQSATRTAVDSIDAIGITIRQINDIAQVIRGTVDDQSSATREIAHNIHEAAASAREVSTNVGNLTQAASETGHNATQLLSASAGLTKQYETLRREVDTFLQKLRRA